MQTPRSVNPLHILVPRDEVESGNIQPTLEVLQRLLASPQTAAEFCERVDIAFHGHEDDRRELWEIEKVRAFAVALDEAFPYWLFFLSKQHGGLFCLMRCFVPPFLTPEGQAQVFPRIIGELLLRRWFPAMNHVCDFVGLEERKRRQLTDHAESYITRGPLPPES